jgi:hypothetical protein
MIGGEQIKSIFLLILIFSFLHHFHNIVSQFNAFCFSHG